MKKIVCLSGLLFLIVAAVSIGAKPPPPPPPPPPYELRMLENEFVPGGTSDCRRINNLGDVIGVAEIPGAPFPNGSLPMTSYVSTPEGRAAGIDMVDLAALFTAHLTPAEQTLWQKPGFADINDSRQIAGWARYVVDGVFVGIIAQLNVLPDGTHSITGFTSLGPNANPVAINNDGDVLVTPLRVYRSGIGFGSPITNVVGVVRMSDRTDGGTLYISGNSSAEERGLRLNYDVVADAITSTVTLQGTYSRDRGSYARDVNSAGMVAGEMSTGRSDWRAFLCDGGVMMNLGTLTSSPDWNDSYGHGVNTQGDVVGGSLTGTVPGNSGLLYIRSRNKTYDSADTLSVDDRAIYTSLEARDSADINDTGIICGPLGRAPVGQATEAYLLLPVP